MFQIKRLKATKVKCGEIENPSRVVLLEIKKFDSIEYSSHIEICPEGEKPYIIHGDYSFDIETALKSFNFRVKRDKLDLDTNFKPDREFTEI